MDELPIELIHYILYEPVIKLNWTTVIKCIKTSKVFQVLNKREVCVLANVSEGYEHCIEKGNLNALQRCIKKEDIQNSFNLSCKYDQLTLAQWIIEYAKSIGTTIDIQDNDIINFIWCCYNNNLKFVQWYIKYANSIGTSIDIHVDNEEAFIISCDNGYLKLAQWLIEYSASIGSPIDIHIKNELAFISSCYNGHLEIAQWLIEYGDSINSPINIHISNEGAYRHSHLNEYFKITEWLIQTYDGFDTTRFNASQLAFYNAHK